MSSTPRPPSVMPLLVMLVLLTPITLTLVSIVSSTLANVLMGESQPSWWKPMGSGLDTLVAMGALGLLLGRLAEDAESSDEPERRRRQGGRARLTGVVAGVAVGVSLAASVNPAFSLAVEALPTLPDGFLLRLVYIEEILSHRAPMDIVAQAAGLCLLPGLMEEWVFRRQLGRLLNQRSLVYRATASSAVFALIHLDPVSMVPLFVAGLVFFAAHGRWGYPAAAAAHAAFNLFGVFVWNRSSWLESPFQVAPVVCVMLAGMVMLAAIERATRPDAELLSVRS